MRFGDVRDRIKVGSIILYLAINKNGSINPTKKRLYLVNEIDGHIFYMAGVPKSIGNFGLSMLSKLTIVCE